MGAMLVLSANQAALNPMSPELSEASSALSVRDAPALDKPGGKPHKPGGHGSDGQMLAVEEVGSVSGWMTLGETKEYSTDLPKVWL